MQVRDVMSDRVIWVTPDTGIQEIAQAMRDGEIGSVPVADNDRLVGMITDRDIVVRGIADSSDVNELTAQDLMSSRMLYCYDDETIEDVLKNMADQQVRRLPVVNRDKRLVGIVSLGDLSQQSEPEQSGSALEQISKPNA